ncbi:MAG: AAA family ATPase [Deltaproteobacteria bacterium]|nr:AAA family ATPase [Deltaproteobacteria bacterium]NCP03813.1 AAA family ATPase [Deltaproteobacteria bacterium]
MYKDFFGLRERPFSKTPDPQYLYASSQHREALARLQHGVEEREIILLTGEIGCGKTTLSRALMDALGTTAKVLLLTNPRLTPLELLLSLALRLGIDPPPRQRPDLLAAIERELYALFEQGHIPVLLIDEAHLIPHRDTFEELRLLTNFQLDDGNLLAILLIGQPELRQRLAHPVYEPLRQRIGLQFHLGALSAAETAAYVKHRILCAGGSGALFTASALDALYRVSRGVPRLINQSASLALLEAYGRGVAQVDAEILSEVGRELEGIQGVMPGSCES